eukprot:TRINITY_DN9425_c0_g1_i2.p1 TRINITY_DN9425_c0_g1~~TRINITY_DN9425_c0_g1_i2.p1  ORF type:complete len:229 (-),score=65.62 TRINITY_DN9425_c0_g1_i2:26-712(-)
MERAKDHMKEVLLGSSVKEGVTDRQLYEKFEIIQRMADLAEKAGSMTGEEIALQELRALQDQLYTEAIHATECRVKVETEQALHEDASIAEKAVLQPHIGGRDALLYSLKLQELVELALQRGVKVTHGSVKLARVGIMNLRAESIRRDAKAMIHASEEEYREKGWIADAATKCADRVEAMINRAVSEGISRDLPKMQAAWQVSKELREQEGWRKREANAAKRRVERGR